MPSSNVIVGKYWLLTIPAASWNPPTSLPAEFTFIKGQKEVGGETGYEHWQVVVCLKSKKRLTGIKALFTSDTHAELSRSAAANQYVFKDDTAVAGTRFELGNSPKKRNSAEDWNAIWESAKSGNLMEIPADIRIRSYHTLKRIKQDHMVPPGDMEDTCGIWYFGVPGAGKSYKARQDYPGAYLKPCNKWWDGYQEHEYVLIDDFDKNHKVLGHHLKIWADRYAFIGESKGGSITIRPKKIVITSNYSIEEIFGEDMTLVAALKRRFVCYQFNFRYNSSIDDTLADLINLPSI